MDSNILLESGTNELEILEFTLGGNRYGINVAKIREILSYQPVTPIPHSNPSVEGIFMPRDIMITVISLKRCIGIPENDDEKKGLFIITNFNKLNVAFHVDEVLGIHRVSWQSIIKPDSTINNDSGVSTGVVKLQDNLIVILDFERIVTDISPETGLKISDVEEYQGRERRDCQILVAEDSPFLSKLITDCLKKAGYTKIIVTANGQEAWDRVCEYKQNGTLDDMVLHCVITDIEMPLMDGHRLTKLMKTDEELKHIPLIIFSSLVNDEMRRKGEQLGADAQLTKPEIGDLVRTIDALIEANRGAIGAEGLE